MLIIEEEEQLRIDLAKEISLEEIVEAQDQNHLLLDDIISQLDNICEILDFFDENEDVVVQDFLQLMPVFR